MGYVLLALSPCVLIQKYLHMTSVSASKTWPRPSSRGSGLDLGLRVLSLAFRPRSTSLVSLTTIQQIMCTGKGNVNHGPQESMAGAHLPLLGLEPIGGEPLMSVTRCQCDARPTVTFPATRHHRPLAGTKLYCSVAEAHVS